MHAPVAIARLMELSNNLHDAKAAGALSPSAFDEGVRCLVLMLAPMAPNAGACLVAACWVAAVK